MVLQSRLPELQVSLNRSVWGPRTPSISHITSVLQQLHWLPFKYRIIYKILLIFKAINNLAPQYLTELLHIKAPTHSLRSSSSIQLILPPARLVTMGSRASSHSAPTSGTLCLTSFNTPRP
ncbi:hypothetical protein N1851_009583 [Merluccius polli]|uniref:Uncharacterized protein n=1 Tax=Merluccius polli TaxID=89951 RepID=A0AA47P3R6_MERPO|nr:hypothetical protein N1851_009583 [Merluccius polli]